MAQDGHGESLVGREASHDGGVVGEFPVAVDLHPIGEEHLNVIEGVRTLRMARDLGFLPGAQMGVNLAAEVLKLAPEPLDLGRPVFPPGDLGQIFDSLLQLLDRLLDVFIFQGQRIPPRPSAKALRSGGHVASDATVCQQ